MRIALISDTHGNFTALKAVLTDMRSKQVERVIFLGDAVTIGCQPVETLQALRQLDCQYIRGNHDEAVLHPESATRLQIAEQLHTSLQWCIQRMGRADLQFIEGFQPTVEVQLNARVSMLCFHGSPLSNTDLVLATTPTETLDGYFAGQTASIWVGGHTHVQMLRRYGDKLIINPGSVGNAFKHAYTGQTPQLLPWAEYGILSVEGETVSAELRRVPFDTREVLRLVNESGIPSAAWWLGQYA